MQHIMGLVRRCVEDYNMINEGDRIAVGVSGGKDSLALLDAMARMREYFPKKYHLEAITLDLGFDGMDFTPVGFVIFLPFFRYSPCLPKMIAV